MNAQKNTLQGDKAKVSLKKPLRIQRLGEDLFTHYCPGCRTHHRFSTRTRFANGYAYNRNAEAPTVQPELRFHEERQIDPANPKAGVSIHTKCHYQMSHGKLHYSLDCTHGLAGQTVRMPTL
jgi:hypothetical protein